MMNKIILSKSPDETLALAKKIAQHLRGGDILCLYGDLGAGKTTFVKGLASGLKIDPNKVNSPTFVIMNIYDGKLPLYHFDFYRLETEDEIAAIGYDEFLYGEGVSVIEWSERFGKLLPDEYLGIIFTHKGDDRRAITLKAVGERYKKILKTTQDTRHKTQGV